MKKIFLLLNITLLMLQSCSSGDSNTNTITVSDADGNIYQTVTICNQTWTKSNLNVSKYSDGTPIPQVTDPIAWQNLTTGAWCYNNNDTANGVVYGKLYNWYAVAGIYDAASASNPALRKKLAPTGWHVPTDDQWSILINCLDPNADGGNNFPNIAGSKLKESGTSHWIIQNTDANNISGFTGLPGGYCGTNGTFGNIGYYGVWWSSSEILMSALRRDLSNNYSSVGRSGVDKSFGASVRCIKN
jgi:uncharacterized protein (TIGR02145 family)